MSTEPIGMPIGRPKNKVFFLFFLFFLKGRREKIGPKMNRSINKSIKCESEFLFEKKNKRKKEKRKKRKQCRPESEARDCVEICFVEIVSFVFLPSFSLITEFFMDHRFFSSITEFFMDYRVFRGLPSFFC